MKKMIRIVLTVTMITMLPLCALADGWAFIGPVHHSYDGVHFSKHSFRGDVCTQCGYRRTPGPDLSPDPQLVDNSCWVMFDAPLYAAADGRWRVIGWVETGDTYHVADVAVCDGICLVQLKMRADRYSSPIGWVEAENLQVDLRPHPDPIGDGGYDRSSEYRGCTIEIIASSGRGRTGAGTEYPYVETVHFRERYTVLDVRRGSNNNDWYQIRVDGRAVWIASGLCRFVWD